MVGAQCTRDLRDLGLWILDVLGFVEDDEIKIVFQQERAVQQHERIADDDDVGAAQVGKELFCASCHGR